jgi:hypothetical protein
LWLWQQRTVKDAKLRMDLFLDGVATVNFSARGDVSIGSVSRTWHARDGQWRVERPHIAMRMLLGRALVILPRVPRSWYKK